MNVELEKTFYLLQKSSYFTSYLSLGFNIEFFPCCRHYGPIRQGVLPMARSLDNWLSDESASLPDDECDMFAGSYIRLKHSWTNSWKRNRRNIFQKQCFVCCTQECNQNFSRRTQNTNALLTLTEFALRTIDDIFTHSFHIPGLFFGFH